MCLSSFSLFLDVGLVVRAVWGLFFVCFRMWVLLIWVIWVLLDFVMGEFFCFRFWFVVFFFSFCGVCVFFWFGAFVLGLYFL